MNNQDINRIRDNDIQYYSGLVIDLFEGEYMEMKSEDMVFIVNLMTDLYLDAVELGRNELYLQWSNKLN